MLRQLQHILLMEIRQTSSLHSTGVSTATIMSTLTGLAIWCQKLIKTPIRSPLHYGDSTRWKYFPNKGRKLEKRSKAMLIALGLSKAHHINSKIALEGSYLFTHSLSYSHSHFLSLLQAENCVNASLTHVSQTKCCPDKADSKAVRRKQMWGQNKSKSAWHWPPFTV